VHVTSFDNLLGTKILYDFPDLMHPKICLMSGDTIDISDYVAISARNKIVLDDIQKFSDQYGHFRKSVGIQSHLQLGDYIVCLSEEVRGKDLLLWKKKDTQYSLLAIYPNEVGVCLYCNPDFYTVNSDTFSIGTVQQEEGSVYGNYDYYVIVHDTLRLVKSMVGNGSCPFTEDESNPTKGATCIGYLNILYDANGKEIHLPIFYECRDKNGNEIYAHAVGDSLSLFKMYWQGIGPLINHVKTGDQKLKVGTSVFHEGWSYIAIEHDGNWFWTLWKEIEIE
jgi:hypothetical protein